MDFRTTDPEARVRRGARPARPRNFGRGRPSDTAPTSSPCGGKEGAARRDGADALEQIGEIYYRIQMGKFVQLSPQFQYLRNPGYNRDRGPVRVAGIRVHLEY